MNRETTAVVTGGNSGIGAEVVKQFLEHGLRVVSVGSGLPEPEHPQLHGFVFDLSEQAGIEEAARRVAAFGPTILVHAAGAIRAALLEQVSFADLYYLTNLHVGTAIGFAQACLPFMKAAGSGRIVLISSRAAIGLATRTVYTATKAALIGLVRTWALELGPHGITVNAIAPGPIATPMLRDGIPQGSAREQTLIASLPMRRLGEPGDIARTVLYLVDPDNGFITGQTLFVCGGASVGSLKI